MKRILVLDNRFVFVGDCRSIKDALLGECVRVENCFNIRKYGTENGLSELSYKGKLENTILDRSMPITIPLPRILLSLEVEAAVQNTFKN